MPSPVGMGTQDTDEHFSLGSSHTDEDHDGSGQRVIPALWESLGCRHSLSQGYESEAGKLAFDLHNNLLD